jgi:hypothetical protein
MRLNDRIYDGWLSRHSYGTTMRIRSGNYTLVVENRDYFTRYRILRGVYYDDPVILWHDVRNPEPLPVRPAQIIHARHIPWFMWIWYGVRDWFRKRQSDRELDEWWEKDKARRAAIRQAVKERGLGRFTGRYNR